MRRNYLRSTIGWFAAAWLLGSSGLAETPAAPSLQVPLPFDHDEHARVLERSGLSCLDCHPIGLRREAAPDRPGRDTSVPLPHAPRATCHGCHEADVKGAGRNAPPDCMLCHSDRGELKPQSHGVDWLDLHGSASRAPDQSCSTCHSAGSCLDCHDRRGAGSVSPHGPGFQRFHGVEAQVDPRSCSTCHTEASCVACHTSGGTPW